MLKSADPKFSLGETTSTSGVLSLNAIDVSSAIRRHHYGDWGDLCEEDIQANEDALKKGERIFSVYHDCDGTKFYIITEHDRSKTTVLLPEEY